jgi:hypothetical protein
MRGQIFSSLTDIAGGGSIQSGTSYVPGRRSNHDSPDRTSCCPRVRSWRRDHTGVGAGPDATGGEEGAGRHQQRLARRAEGGDGQRGGAKKIVENRPYKSTDELVQKKVMPKATYDKIKGQIVAK